MRIFFLLAVLFLAGTTLADPPVNYPIAVDVEFAPELNVLLPEISHAASWDFDLNVYINGSQTIIGYPLNSDASLWEFNIVPWWLSDGHLAFVVRWESGKKPKVVSVVNYGLSGNYDKHSIKVELIPGL